MKINETSMEKLYDLMTMGVKYQVRLAQRGRECGILRTFVRCHRYRDVTHHAAPRRLKIPLSATLVSLVQLPATDSPKHTEPHDCHLGNK